MIRFYFELVNVGAIDTGILSIAAKTTIYRDEQGCYIKIRDTEKIPYRVNTLIRYLAAAGYSVGKTWIKQE